MKEEKTWEEVKNELFEKYQLPPEAVDRSEKYPLAYPSAKAIFECTEPGSMEDFIAEGGHIFYLADPSEIKKQLGENEFVVCDRAYSHIPMGSIVKVNPDKCPRVGFALIEFAGEFTDKNGTVQSAEDKNQSYRRFPFVIKLKSDSYDLLVNKSVIYQTKEFQEFTRFKNVCGNFQDIKLITKTTLT